MNDFIGKLEKIQKGEMLDVTLVLDDPCGNSYLQEIHYERTFEQNETIGLNDMKTEDYGEQ